MVYVEHEEDQQRQQLLPLGDDRHLAVRLRVDQVGDAEPHLDAGELAAELHAREDELRDEAEEDAERRLRGEHGAEGPEVGRRREPGAADGRRERRRDRRRNRDPHAHRDEQVSEHGCREDESRHAREDEEPEGRIGQRHRQRT